MSEFIKYCPKCDKKLEKDEVIMIDFYDEDDYFYQEEACIHCNTISLRKIKNCVCCKQEYVLDYVKNYNSFTCYNCVEKNYSIKLAKEFYEFFEGKNADTISLEDLREYCLVKNLDAYSDKYERSLI